MLAFHNPLQYQPCPLKYFSQPKFLKQMKPHSPRLFLREEGSCAQTVVMETVFLPGGDFPLPSYLLQGRWEAAR